MTLFLILAALLVAGALLFVVPPMLGLGSRRRAQSMRQKQAETALVVLREQVAELESDHAAGKIGEVEYQRARVELEERALEEGRAADDGSDQRPASLSALVLVLAVPLVAVVVYLSIGEPGGLDPVQVAGEQHEQITPEQLTGLVAQLVDRLEQDPSDETGWAMLARSYAMLGDLETATRTWQRIGSKVPDNANVLVDWADLLVAAQEGDFSGEPQRLIDRALLVEPDNFKALALAGAAAFERDDYATASAFWERILTQVPRGDPAYQSVVASINEARGRGGMPLLEPDPVPGASADADALRLGGRVRLSEAFADEVLPEQTVFVFVRSVEGGIPYAALRIPVGDLPARFSFADAPRMNAAALPERVIVAARLSKHGDPSPQPGDLEGFSELVSPESQDIELVIDRVVD